MNLPNKTTLMRSVGMLRFACHYMRLDRQSDYWATVYGANYDEACANAKRMARKGFRCIKIQQIME